MSELKKENKKIEFISWLQFIGVCSVIIGHSTNGLDLPSFIGLTLPPSIKGWIYTYHIPLFFFVSAFLFAYKGGFSNGYKKVFIGRFQRLIVPYLIWNLAFALPKYLVSEYIYDQVEFNVMYFVEIMLYPRRNILGHTWFLAGLFEMYVIAILFEKIRKKKQLWFLVFAALVVVNCFGVTERFLAVGDLMKNAVFFWTGLMLGDIGPEKIISWFKDKYVGISIVLITCFSTVVWEFLNDMIINTLVLGFSALALFVLIQVRFDIKGKFIEFISDNSFAIYILHWPVMVAVRYIFYTRLNFNVYVSMLIMLVLGFVVPIAIVLVARQIKVPVLLKIRKYIFGI